jgi:mannonate dehydratase
LPEGYEGASADALWENLQAFLKEVIPVAEKCGVKLALHPDDPPIDHLNGQDRIITTPEAMQRVVELVPSDANGLCFCQGTFASRGGIDIPSAIEKLSPHITMAHFRDVTGELPSFKESFVDNGKTDMVACMEAYLNCPNDFVIRPDHVPTLAGEGADNPGYKTLGRLHAIGYMQGLVHALER